MDALAQERLGAADLGGAWKKDQQRSRFGAQGARHGIGDLPLDRRARVAPEIARLDRKGAAGPFDHRRIAKELADACAVERCRHDQELELRSQGLLHVAGKRQAEVGVERALMELVEQNSRDARKRGIVENEPREDAFGHDFDARRRGDFGAETDAVADARADRLTECCRHARGRSPCGEPARLEHDEFLSRGPRLRRQHQRNPRRLAGAWRGHQHRGRLSAQRSCEFRQCRIDRKRLVARAHRRHFAFSLRTREAAPKNRA